jgi:carbonic anhydrase/acetyltransferase-like protein (isoleucine patch superfamily)
LTRSTGRRAILALLLILAPLVALRAKAEGASLSIPKGTIRTGDVVVLGREILLEGELEGNAVLVGGATAVVSGRIRRDLILLGSGATIKRGAVIDGDVLAVGGSLTFEEIPGGHSSNATGSATSSQVGGRIRTITALEAAVVSELETSPLTSGKSSPLVLSFRLFLLFCWLVVSFGLLFLAPRPVLRAVDGARGRLAFLAALGATAVLTAVFLAAFALSVLPARFALVLGVALLVALAAAKIFGLAVLFVVLGRRATRRAVRGDLLFGDPAALALGLLLLGLASLIPVAGPLAWGLASLAGIGVSLAAAASRERRLVLATS